MFYSVWRIQNAFLVHCEDGSVQPESRCEENEDDFPASFMWKVQGFVNLLYSLLA
jgi:hypothetical protein